MAENSADDDGPKDLLGDPWKPLKDPRGRRKLMFAPEAYEKVRNLRGLGMNLEEISTELGISIPSLKKYFLPELKGAEAQVKAKVLQAILKSALAGRVGAMRLALDLLDQGSAQVPVARDVKAPPPRPEPLGKKAEADLAAQSAPEGSEWGHLLKH